MIRQIPKLILVSIAIFSGILVFAIIDCFGPSFRVTALRLQFARLVNRVLAFILRIKVATSGHELEDLKALPGLKGRLIVANHLSYLDAIALGSIMPVRFVAKQEVRNWPVLGQLASLAGTIFIDRESPRQGLRVANEIADSLRHGVSVVLFPEGTSSNGERLLEFKPLLFTGAVRASAPVQPLIIRYTSVNQNDVTERNRETCYWYGAMEFAPHFWRVLGLKQISVTVEVLEMIDTMIGDTIHDIASSARKAIAERYESQSNRANEAASMDEHDDFILGALVLALANGEGSSLGDD